MTALPDEALDERDVDDDPLVQVARWYQDAIDGGLVQPDAVQVATVDAAGQPSARTVLLKGIDERGLSFFTSYESRKGVQLAQNPRCALVLLWKPLERQVNVTGVAERLPARESDEYFATRPRGSQLGAWASAQSTVIDGRASLERALADVEARYDGVDVPRPPHWGGYIVRPDTIELWKGRRNRLHDRLRYSRHGGGWVLERLSP
ncbi:MAG TPA: pyridoxamine 5'-phosphate oxidase [Acidimicrobiales bacterium]|nr:pyridoxamine 5'-phosphate oxidase [Acidimicrobiales bacterium]